jgi:hypothetical protein
LPGSTATAQVEPGDEQNDDKSEQFELHTSPPGSRLQRVRQL